MIMDREQIIILENLAKEQRRVYEDACDFGVPYNQDTTKRVRAGLEGGTQISRTTHHHTHTVVHFFPVERNDHNPDLTDGIEVTVELLTNVPTNSMYKAFKERCSQKAFYTIEIKRASRVWNG